MKDRVLVGVVVGMVVTFAALRLWTATRPAPPSAPEAHAYDPATASAFEKQVAAGLPDAASIAGVVDGPPVVVAVVGGYVTVGADLGRWQVVSGPDVVPVDVVSDGKPSADLVDVAAGAGVQAVLSR